eukprot:9008558-Prorocentrum_lima.AAC.1
MVRRIAASRYPPAQCSCSGREHDPVRLHPDACPDEFRGVAAVTHPWRYPAGVVRVCPTFRTSHE